MVLSRSQEKFDTLELEAIIIPSVWGNHTHNMQNALLCAVCATPAAAVAVCCCLPDDDLPSAVLQIHTHIHTYTYTKQTVDEGRRGRNEEVRMNKIIERVCVCKAVLRCRLFYTLLFSSSN